MSRSNKEIWFRAKCYGIGWDLPVTWEGWFVYLGYFILLIWGILVLFNRGRVFEFVIFVFFITVMLIAVCLAKGEPLKWRWGGE